jgi:hypothetical protein
MVQQFGKMTEAATLEQVVGKQIASAAVGESDDRKTR